jgi:GxxExxY protein
MRKTKSYIKALIYEVTGAAIYVHSSLGPGLLESLYQKCFQIELTTRGISFQAQPSVPIIYRDHTLEAPLRADLFVDDILVVELKSVDSIHPIHEAQILTYMKLLQVPKGLIINFNVTNIVKEGQRAYVNELYRTLPE